MLISLQYFIALEAFTAGNLYGPSWYRIKGFTGVLGTSPVERDNSLPSPVDQLAHRQRFLFPLFQVKCLVSSQGLQVGARFAAKPPCPLWATWAIMFGTQQPTLRLSVVNNAAMPHLRCTTGAIDHDLTNRHFPTVAAKQELHTWKFA